MTKALNLHALLLMAGLLLLTTMAAAGVDAAAGCPFAQALGRRSLKQASGLEYGYYDPSCPKFESIVADRMEAHTLDDIRTPSKILRLFFHDCAVQGCDASILLKSTGTNRAENDATISATLDKLFVIEDIKAYLEDACPGVVSCADILASAAAYAVRMAGGPTFASEYGRRDGRESFASSATKLAPLSTQKVPSLLSTFANIGLDQTDLVALSGAHTIGEIHCTNFADRYQADANSPFPDAAFGDELWAFCTNNGASPDFATLDRTTFIDSNSPNSFDTQYYVSLVQGRGVMTSDQDLFNNPRTRPLVQSFADDPSLFFDSFVASMLKLGRQGVLTGNRGDIRKQCAVSP